MKKIALILCAVLLLLPFTACGKKPEPASTTAEFYHSINYSSFYYKATVTKNNTTYVYIQAVDSDSCTTIEDHTNDNMDKYVITEGDLMHGLDMENKRYDTLQSKNVTKFMFAQNDYTEFNNPTSSETVYIYSNPYWCESFAMVDNGAVVGEIKYYFSGSKLAAIEWYENGECTAFMMLSEYSETIPEHIYTSIPEGYSAGIFSSEQEVDPF